MWVTNNSDKNLEDGYDGIRYTFPHGESIEIPMVVARHVFGFGDDNKSPYLIRLGWIQKSDDYQNALKRLQQFSFSPEKPTIHSLSPVVDTKTLALPKKRSGVVVPIAA
jgi:hypothetical protein